MSISTTCKLSYIKSLNISIIYFVCEEYIFFHLKNDHILSF